MKRMKRAKISTIISRLNPVALGNIKRVLDIYTVWGEVDGMLECPMLDCDLCRSLFPRCKKTWVECSGEILQACPCDCYSRKYILKHARHILKEGGKANEVQN